MRPMKINSDKFSLKSLKKLIGSKILNFSKSVDSLMVVSVESELTLMEVQFKGGLKIKALKIVPIDQSQQKESILKSLREFIKQNNIQHENVIFKPFAKAFFAKRIQLPAVPESELPGAIRWQVKDDVSFDPAGAIVYYDVIRTTVGEDGRKILDLTCLLAQESEIRNQLLVLKEAGLKPLAVRFSGIGYVNIIDRYFKTRKDEINAFLHIGGDVSYIIVCKGQHLIFHRMLPIGFDQLVGTLRGVLSSEKGKIELSQEEAIEAMSKLGVIGGESIYKDKINSSQVLAMMRSVLDRLCAEIKRSLAYFYSEFDSEKINKLFLGGLVGGIAGIDKFLNNELSLETRVISLEGKVEVAKSVDPQELSRSASCLGLVFNYHLGADFLPYEYRTENFENLERISLRWAAFIIILFLGVSFIFTKVWISIYKQRLDTASLHLQVVSELKEMRENTGQLSNFIAGVRNSELFTAYLIKILNSFRAEDMIITNFSLDAVKKSGSIKGYVSQGETNPHVVLSNFAKQMEESGYFKDVTLSSIKKSGELQSESSGYNLTFRVP